MKLRVVEQLVPRDNGRPAADITPASARKFALLHCRYFSGDVNRQPLKYRYARRVCVLFQDRSSSLIALMRFSSLFFHPTRFNFSTPHPFCLPTFPFSSRSFQLSSSFELFGDYEQTLRYELLANSILFIRSIIMNNCNIKRVEIIRKMESTVIATNVIRGF